MKIFIFMLLLTSNALAYPSGICKSSEGYYKNVKFKVEESSDLTYAVEFQKAHRGQLITDKDGEFFSVIWHEEIAAPATGYTCFRVEES